MRPAKPFVPILAVVLAMSIASSSARAAVPVGAAVTAIPAQVVGEIPHTPVPSEASVAGGAGVDGVVRGLSAEPATVAVELTRRAVGPDGVVAPPTNAPSADVVGPCVEIVRIDRALGRPSIEALAEPTADPSGLACVDGATDVGGAAPGGSGLPAFDGASHPAGVTLAARLGVTSINRLGGAGPGPRALAVRFWDRTRGDSRLDVVWADLTSGAESWGGRVASLVRFLRRLHDPDVPLLLFGDLGGDGITSVEPTLQRAVPELRLVAPGVYSTDGLDERGRPLWEPKAIEPPPTVDLSRQVTVTVGRLTALSSDCDGDLEFYGAMAVGGRSQAWPRLGGEVDIDPNWSLSTMAGPGSTVLRGAIEVGDDDSIDCDGGFQLVDVTPRVDSRALRFEVDLGEGTIAEITPSGRRGEIIGRTGRPLVTTGRLPGETGRMTWRVDIDIDIDTEPDADVASITD